MCFSAQVCSRDTRARVKGENARGQRRKRSRSMALEAKRKKPQYFCFHSFSFLNNDNNNKNYLLPLRGFSGIMNRLKKIQIEHISIFKNPNWPSEANQLAIVRA